MEHQDQTEEQVVHELGGLRRNDSKWDPTDMTARCSKPIVPDSLLSQWQSMANLLAKICSVPAALIMKVHSSEIEVIIAAKSDGNPYHAGEKTSLNAKLYCEHVMTTGRMLLVANALEDPNWNQNPDIALGMISYLGYPLLWPDGDVFGTICILDSKANPYSNEIEQQVALFRDMVESHLAKILEVYQHRRTEEALRMSEERYKNFFLTSRDCVFITALDGKLIDVNDAGKELFGYMPDDTEEILRMNAARFYANPADRENLIKIIAEKGFSKDYPLDLRKKDGSIINALVTTVCRKDRQGNPIGFQGTIRDITDRNLWEQTLQNAVERFYTILSSLYSGLLIVTNESTVEFVNQAMCDLFDLEDSPVSLQGLTTSEIIEELRDSYAEPDEIVGRIRKTIARNRPLKGIEVPIRGGRTFLVDYIPLEIDGKSAGRVWHHTDISAIKAIEKLRESEEQFRLLAEVMADIVWTTDLNFRTTYVSPSINRLLGFSPEERKLQRVEEQVTPESLIRMRERLAAELAIETEGTADPERSITVEAEYYKSDGTTAWFESRVKAIRDPQGTIVGFHGVSRDITERKRAEEEREMLRAQLLQSQKMETIGTLAAGIAHDFNNMLTVTLGYSSMLLADKHVGDPGYKELQAIVKTSQDAAELVQRLRIFSRRADLKPVSLNLNHEIEEVAKILGRTLPRIIDMDVRLAQPLATIHADPSQMKQIVMNLAINASEAMPYGGSLTIQTDNISLDEEYCKVHVGVKPGQYVMLQIADTGHGIDKGLIERIFDPFYSTKPKDSKRGTGLGLSVVQGIVELHGGHITAESEVGRGTIFKIYFAVVEPKKAPAVVEKKIELPDGGSETILLVEDEELVRDLGVRMLERFGFTVLTACDGQEAVDIYKKHQANIALVILDVVMPKMEGKQCLLELLRINPVVKVIVSSGLDPEGLVKEIVELGAKDSVNKPYSMKQMIQKVREVLDSD